MKKSIYLMAPTRRDLSQKELFERVDTLMSLGLPIEIESVKAHPHIINHCQSSVSPTYIVGKKER